MYNALKVVVLLCAIIATSSISQGSVSALSNRDLILTDDPLFAMVRSEKLDKKLSDQESETSDNNEKKDDPVIDDSKAKSEPVTHVVGSGESLSIIAKNYSTTWQRLFDKNTSIENPDVISVGETLTIPSAEEELVSRPLPEAAVIKPITATSTTKQNQISTASANRTYTSTASTADNTYAAGYCTWYAKSRRPDLPNRMGNASSWVASAAARGFATGSTPRVGAIGQQGNHVVYVESVNGDGTVTVSEMNYKGLFVVSSRTVAASNFRYIY